jgi:hypothetical protein
MIESIRVFVFISLTHGSTHVHDDYSYGMFQLRNTKDSSKIEGCKLSSDSSCNFFFLCVSRVKVTDIYSIDTISLVLLYARI